VDEAQVAKQAEADAVAARSKELKALYIDELKELAAKNGIEVKKKDEIIKALLAKEAKNRAAERERVASIRAVVLNKKQELESKAA